jgi:hypothetical protein
MFTLPRCRPAGEAAYSVAMSVNQSPCGILWEGMHDHTCALERDHHGPHVCQCGEQQA